MALVAAADALQEGDPFWDCSIGGALDVASGGAAGGEHALVLQGCDHVRIASQTVLFGELGVVDLVAGREDDGADLHLLGHSDHFMVDGVDPAGEDTAHALRADAARQAAGGFSLGAVIVVAAFDLDEIIHALLDRQFWQRHASSGDGSRHVPAYLRSPAGRSVPPEARVWGRLQRLALQVADDRLGGGVAAVDSFDHECGAGDASRRRRIRPDEWLPGYWD